MSLIDERAFREMVAEEIRRAIREELGPGGRPGSDDEYLPVAAAAARAAVAPATIRAWMAQGRLRRYYAGRELRVRAPELMALMSTPPVAGDAAEGERSSPEREAELYLARRRQRRERTG
jgi:hypothetical protein